MAAPRTGQQCKLYRNSSGNHASPTWVLIAAVKDLTLGHAVDKADVSDRGSKHKKYISAMIENSISFGLTYQNGDANHAALRAAAFDGTAIEFAIMSGDITTSGEEGLRAFCQVFGFDHEQPLADGVTVNVEIAPTYHEESSAVVDPDWYVVA